MGSLTREPARGNLKNGFAERHHRTRSLGGSEHVGRRSRNPSDIAAVLQDNVDRIAFRSFNIIKTTKDEECDWLCGTMSARFADGNYYDVQFVAQIYPELTFGTSGPRSWITLRGAGLIDASNQYGQRCQK